MDEILNRLAAMGLYIELYNCRPDEPYEPYWIATADYVAKDGEGPTFAQTAPTATLAVALLAQEVLK